MVQSIQCQWYKWTTKLRVCMCSASSLTSCPNKLSRQYWQQKPHPSEQQVLMYNWWRHNSHHHCKYWTKFLRKKDIFQCTLYCISSIVCTQSIPFYGSFHHVFFNKRIQLQTKNSNAQFKYLWSNINQDQDIVIRFYEQALLCSSRWTALLDNKFTFLSLILPSSCQGTCMSVSSHELRDSTSGNMKNMMCMSTNPAEKGTAKGVSHVHAKHSNM